MFSSIDEGKGTVRTTWKEVRDRFEKVDPHLTKLIDNVSPDENFPIYLLYFPYGMLKGDTNDSYLPLSNGDVTKLSDPNIDKTILDDLGYGMHSSPLGIILDKYIEYFIEFNEQAFPYLISGPGTIFNKGILFTNKGIRNYSPNGILKATSGSRTAFMLPSINNQNGISKLSKEVNKKLITPRKTSEHFNLFKEINGHSNKPWYSCLAYFSKNWISHILTDHNWVEIKNYIIEGKTNKDSFNANNTFFEVFCSRVQKDRNLRLTSPYLTNTAIHLIKVALGEFPGYMPAVNEDKLPLENIQMVIEDAFQLKKTPTVMIPHSLIFEKEQHPVYYSLQYPTTHYFLLKKNERVTANNEIDTIDDILCNLLDEMSKEGSLLEGTVFADIPKNIDFNYFHNYPPKESKLIKNSRQLSELDPRFCYSTLSNTEDFSFEGQFLRGCIQIQPKKIE